MSVFEHPEYAGHERVVFWHDQGVGLRAITAIHRLRGGLSGGGIRFYPYRSSADALTDVLRLSRAMSYKMALTGLPLGGGKTVVIGDPATEKTPALLHALGRWVDSLGGQYLCAPDVGTSSADMAVIREVTPHVTGLPGAGGNTAIPTARGLLRGIEAAVRFRLGRDSLRGLTIAVQGVGAVGSLLCRHLHEAGARLILADVDRAAADALAAELGADVVGTDEILFAKADVVAPCALGAILDDDSVPRIRAAIVCGGANNQLKEPRHGRLLHERGILFAPDYVVNCGGTLGGAAQAGMFSADQLESRLARIYDTALRVFEIAATRNLPPDAAAQSLAEELLAEPHRQ
ncbi:MAG TPA: Glu/Leu/Phe/Val dehydrogenase dimerization domain-containing protein [Gemmatimonadales bacterium]